MIVKFDDEKPELNITPLVDIMLVLLAILMVTAPTLKYEDDIILPSGSKTKILQTNVQNLIIRVSKDKKVHIDNRNLSLIELPDNLVLLKQRYSIKSPVYIKADKRLLYSDVMFVLKSVKEAGFSKVALQTNG